ncbi:uncharacterized protein LOC5522037 isoform X4 [Nematostella vectensis]|uniref:uncharacterized protein LOC5522037 isoform X4 n=1 Tax=Nematostella vectensis TaxID=45351 RepID=UPI0020775E8F|nr:uncharacterized protein LOC5522037 isoform X4 [Nematostella vectensis]
MIEPLGLLNLTGAYKKHWLAPLTHTIWETRHLLDKTWGRLQGISLHPNFISQKQIKMYKLAYLFLVAFVFSLISESKQSTCNNECQGQYTRCFLPCNDMYCGIQCGMGLNRCQQICRLRAKKREIFQRMFDTTNN